MSAAGEVYKENNSLQVGGTAMQLSRLIKETLIADNIPGFAELSSKTGKSL
jgi:hypothetical protein